jgi:hypothetical protein
MIIQKGKFIAEISEPKRADEFTTTKITHLEDCLHNLTLHDLRDLKRVIDGTIGYLYEVE